MVGRPVKTSRRAEERALEGVNRHVSISQGFIDRKGSSSVRTKEVLSLGQFSIHSLFFLCIFKKAVTKNTVITIPRPKVKSNRVIRL